ncbi:PREDICTED: uncharacterized protein LOC105570459 isoform X2 [Vollenhovia emeryi]|uniref:uncharacterized protein LOC105570459 isoform X2 n=1 Tax=Vollenhovia emeryi TaxID=411798 RepID=UPI0005F58AE9|nr:PREDICTED: uncharacterized protein LOC105570459 isoform X2 [Vollenhovia emeryi]
MEQARLESLPWPACLAVRENILPSGVPHIPLLVEDIPRYTSLPDYRENCVKSVQTIGEIVPGAGRVASLQSVSAGREARITLSLETLPPHAVYLQDEEGKWQYIWEKCHIFKVFGTLEQRENEVVLVAHKLLKVQDVRGSLETLALLSTAVRPMYYHV